MSNCPVFITAPNVTVKEINKTILMIQDFEFSGDKWESASPYVLLTSTTLPEKEPSASLPPIPESALEPHDFFSKSISEINEFVRTNEEALKKLNLGSSIWVIIDEKGIKTETVLICEQIYDDDLSELTDKSQCCRVPYVFAWGMYANLDIANLDFEDYVDEDAGEQDDGTWKFEMSLEDPKSARERREKVLKKFKDDGVID